jgi:ribosomal protein L33
MPSEGPCTHEVELIRYCKRCRRKLKAEASMKIGYGPVCVKKAEHKEAA